MMADGIARPVVKGFHPPVRDAQASHGAAVPLFETAMPRNPSIKVTLNDQTVVLQPKQDGQKYQFLDMLNLTNLDPTKPQGNIILRLNGRNASYLEEVHHGDVVEIRWDNT